MKKSHIETVKDITRFNTQLIIFLFFFSTVLVVLFDSTPVTNPTPQLSLLKPILEEFAHKSWHQTLPNVTEPENEHLLMALDNPSQLDQQTIVDQKVVLENREIADAPAMRQTFEAKTKLCLAETYKKNEPDRVMEICQIKDTYPVNVNWNESVDDITAVAQVLPYAVLGEYYQESNPAKSIYYYRQIELHRRAGIATFGDDFEKMTGDTYSQILSLVPTPK